MYQNSILHEFENLDSNQFAFSTKLHNLKFAGLTTTDKGVAATISISSGTFYWESTQLSNSGGSNCYAGVILTGASSDVNANKIYVRGDGIVIKYGTSLGTVN